MSSTSTASSTLRPLFGGAIACLIPNAWRDVASIRQVPDHQECWQDDAGKLLTVEILERQAVQDEKAAAYFFEDLAEAESNAAYEKSFQAVANPGMTLPRGLPASTSVCFGVGFQRLKLGKAVDLAGNPRVQEARAIRVEVCAIRLVEKETDILITLSTPSEPNPQETADPAAMSEVFKQAAASFQIQDWSLFG